MPLSKRELSEAIHQYGEHAGHEELLGVLARSMIGIAHANNAEEISFNDDIGAVTVVAKYVPKENIN